MTNLDRVLKKLTEKGLYNLTDKGKYIVKAMVFPVVMYRYECWTIKKTEC